MEIKSTLLNGILWLVLVWRVHHPAARNCRNQCYLVVNRVLTSFNWIEFGIQTFEPRNINEEFRLRNYRCRTDKEFFLFQHDTISSNQGCMCNGVHGWWVDNLIVKVPSKRNIDLKFCKNYLVGHTDIWHRFQRKPLISDPSRDACLDRLPTVARKTYPAFPAHAQPAILRIW